MDNIWTVWCWHNPMHFAPSLHLRFLTTTEAFLLAYCFQKETRKDVNLKLTRTSCCSINSIFILHKRKVFKMCRIRITQRLITGIDSMRITFVLWGENNEPYPKVGYDWECFVEGCVKTKIICVIRVRHSSLLTNMRHTLLCMKLRHQCIWEMNFSSEFFFLCVFSCYRWFLLWLPDF